MRRLPIAFCWLTRRGDAVTARWMRPLQTQPGIRRDAVKILRSVAANRRLLVDIPDSYTLVPLDQPAKLAAAIREFIPAAAGARRPVQ
jgi:hypothetical protein